MFKNTCNYTFKGIMVLNTLFALSACKTYYIPVDSFKEQFVKAATDTGRRKVSMTGPNTFIGQLANSSYTTFRQNYIDAVDNKGNATQLAIIPAIEVRFTDTSGKRTSGYFDNMDFDGENIILSRSRMLPNLKKNIPLAAIKKIEVQNGGKKYQYEK